MGSERGLAGGDGTLGRPRQRMSTPPPPLPNSKTEGSGLGGHVGAVLQPLTQAFAQTLGLNPSLAFLGDVLWASCLTSPNSSPFSYKAEVNQCTSRYGMGVRFK